MKETDFKYLNSEEIDLLELCEKCPELANDIVNSINVYPMIYNKRIKGITSILFDKKPFNIKNKDKIVTIKGTVIKTNQVFLKNVKTQYTCLKCNFKGLSGLSSQKVQMNIICDSCGSNSLLKSECVNETMKSQNVRIQDIENISGFTETYELLLEGDLAGRIVPGEEVLCTGVVSVKWKKFKINEPMVGSYYLHVLNLEKINDSGDDDISLEEQFEFIEKMPIFEKRKYLIKSFLSDIYGYSNVKFGILLVLSSDHSLKNDNSGRTSSHILLVGDSGTGKSHFLKACKYMISPSVLTNGVGTTCAVRQGKDWSLEAGALVLADGGICCIDEFNRLKTNEKGGLLEAMEQQTISIAKAGIVGSINTRCSIIAACNMKHFYDKNKTVSDNTQISTPLVSRFDLIFGMFDTKNKTTDQEISNNILNRCSEDYNLPKKRRREWSHGDVKKYLKHIKNIKVEITPEINRLLHKYYNIKRKKQGPSEFNTIRMLESLVRLTVCHAKLMNKGNVDLDDAYAIIILFETTISSDSCISLKFNDVFINQETYNECKCYIEKIMAS